MYAIRSYYADLRLREGRADRQAGLRAAARRVPRLLPYEAGRVLDTRRRAEGGDVRGHPGVPRQAARRLGRVDGLPAVGHPAARRAGRHRADPRPVVRPLAVPAAQGDPRALRGAVGDSYNFV